MTGLLQLGPTELPRWVTIVSQGSDVLSGAIGLGIAYLAYRGYRRNQSRPMLFISLGFILSIGIPFVLLLPLVLVPSLPSTLQSVTVVLTDICNVSGLACILYAIWMPAD